MIRQIKVKKPGLKNNNFYKSWYDEDCRNSRSEYMKAKQNFRRLNSQANFELLKQSSKAYKKKLTKSFVFITSQLIKN